jgi:hypothetical protein
MIFVHSVLNKMFRTTTSKILGFIVLILLLTSSLQYYDYLQDEAYFKSLTRGIRQKTQSDSDFSVLVMDYVFREVYKQLDANNLPLMDKVYLLVFNGARARSSLTYHNTMINDSPCSEIARVFIVILKAGNIKSYRLRSDNHTLVEVFLDGKWRLFDPSVNFIWRKPNGEIASFKEVQADSLLWSQVLKIYPKYAYRFKTETRMGWNRFPLPLLKLPMELFYTRDELSKWNTPLWMIRPSLLGSLVTLCLAIVLVIGYFTTLYIKQRHKNKNSFNP